MFARFVLLLALVFLCCSQPASAQTQAPREHSFTDIVEWVKREGQEDLLSKGAARLFGWGEGDVVVIRIALAKPETGASFAFDVVKDKPFSVLFWRRPFEMLVWQMSPSGELLKTLRADGGGVKLVENELYRADWQEGVNVFRGLVQPPR